MSSAARWNIAVSAETDKALRVFLAHEGGKKGDLSRFVEEAVRAHILELTVEQAKTENLNLEENEISNAIAKALKWSRGSK